VIFLIDGVMWQAVETAMAGNAAANMKFLVDNGVRAELAHSSSPAVLVEWPGGPTRPWGGATSGNSVIHTGTHLLDVSSAGMDDIFLDARSAGIKSIFSGGDNNYQVYTTPDYHQSLSTITDEAVVQYAITQLKADRAVRLLRIHLQRIRDDWTGPANMTNASSMYIQHLIRKDLTIGTLTHALRDVGVWDDAYSVFGSDHGMGTTTASTHVPSQTSSWNNFLVFYGPGLKKGATIPYAELPDVPVTAMRWLGLPPRPTDED